MLSDETLHIGQTAAGKMRPGDAEMVQELGEAGLDRRVPDGTDGGCYGRSPYSGIGTNNAPSGIQDRSCSLRPQCPAVTAPAGTGRQNCIRRGCGEAARAFRAARARVQGLARLAAEGLPSEHGLDSVPFVLLGDHRQAHNLSILLCQHMAREVVPRVKPEGRLSCSLCMISTIAPESLSLSRL
jgi:hypothetical protein